METYYRRRRLRNTLSENNTDQMMSLKRKEIGTFGDGTQVPPLGRHLLQTYDDHDGEKRLEVGSVHEVNQLNLPTRTPVQLRSIRVVMVTEKTELNVSVRYPSIGSLCNYLSNNKMKSTDIYPFLDEVFVMGTHLAGKVLGRRISSQEFDDNNHFEGFWLLKNSPGPVVEHGFCEKESTTPLMSQLKSNGMVQWGIRRQVKFLNRNGDNSTGHPQSSASFVRGSEEKMNLESDEDNVAEKHEQEGEEDDDDDDEEEEEEEENDEDKEEEGIENELYEDNKETVKRKRYSLRENARKAKKVKRSKQKQVYKKKTKNKCKKMIVGHSINRWSAERYKLAERNLLEVMKAKGAVFNSPILRPELRLEARKRIGDTGLLDHLLKHVSGKLAPGGAERFRRRHNADGAMEYWLESADLVRVRKEAGVQDPYWTPPPGWTPGDCPSQDPTCAKEFRLLKEENAKIKRDMENMLSKKQLKEELQNLRREINVQFSKMQEEILALTVQSSGAISQNLNIDASLMAPWKSDFDSALVQVNKQTKQLTDISDSLIGMKDEIGKLNSMVGLASKTTDSCAEIEKKQATPEKSKKVAVKEGVSGEKTAAEAKAAKLQKLKSGFRICKPQGTFLWPNMGANNNNSNQSSQVVVQVEGLFMVQTPPSVSSSSASAPPQLPYHHHPPPPSPIRPVPERRPVAVTIKTAADQQNPNNGYSNTTITSTRNNKTTSLINLNDIPFPEDGVSAITATKPHRGTASAWEYVGCSPNSKTSTSVAEYRANAGEGNKKGSKLGCASSTLCLSGVAGPQLPLAVSANSTSAWKN